LLAQTTPNERRTVKMTQIAMDVHKNHSTLAALNLLTGEMLVRKFNTDRNDLARKLADLPKPWTVAVESSRHSPAVCRWLQAMGADVRLVNAAELARHTKGKAAKTDAKDAEKMLQLMRIDELPECYLASEQVVQLRDLMRGRNLLVEVNTTLRNWLRSALARFGLRVNYTDLRGQAARELVPELIGQLPGNTAMMATIFWALLAQLEEHLGSLNAEVKRQVSEHPVAAALCELPGIGPVTALELVAEIGIIERFADPGRLHSYAGVVPRVDQSGDSRRTGKIARECNRHLRRAAVRAAQGAARCRADNEVRRTYRRVKYRCGANSAKIAGARKALTAVLFTWRELMTEAA